MYLKEGLYTIPNGYYLQVIIIEPNKKTLYIGKVEHNSTNILTFEHPICPAIIRYDTRHYEITYRNFEGCHRIDGPAYTSCYYDGTVRVMAYYQDGKRHRYGGAQHYTRDTVFYAIDGVDITAKTLEFLERWGDKTLEENFDEAKEAAYILEVISDVRY